MLVGFFLLLIVDGRALQKGAKRDEIISMKDEIENRDNHSALHEG